MANKVVDLTGQKFGKLTVIGRHGYTDGNKRKIITWLCRCECGTEVLRTAAHLKAGYCSSCRQCEGIKDDDFIGKQFGFWTVISSANGNSRKKAFLCKCKCGNEKIVNADMLLLGKSKSCGCFHSEYMSKKLTTHGQTGKRIMSIYYNIKRRCYCENNKRFSDYGGRGIKMCDEWKNNSAAFVSWAFENGYDDDLTIDRIDNDGDYSPENCRWITSTAQANNKRNSIYFTFFGVTKNLKEWCDCIGENYKKMYGRYHRGYETFRENDIEKIEKYLKDGGT